jgi:hypothetical protein
VLTVVSWGRFAEAEPALAARVESCLRARRHHVMATLRADGSPRLSGTEVAFVDGDLRIGMMPGTRRGDDLRRDPRVALHSQGVDPPEDDPGGWAGEAKVAGRAVAVPDAATGGESFAIGIDEVVFTSIGSPADHLVVEWWSPAGGLRRIERY